MKNCTLYQPGSGLRDGETLERVWAEVSPIWGLLRTSAQVRDARAGRALIA